jgi:rSAM/selenodomain-associated transferase 2/rSAM/selenodomain-associated transferase 1
MHPDRLIVFGRYPAPGKVKTRLARSLGPARAAELQRRLTEEALSLVRRFSSDRRVDVEVCFDGGTKRKMKRWIGPRFLFSMQTGGDLGARMKASLEAAFKDGCRKVVLHGTDIPGLTVSHLEEAFYALKENDLVLGPSTDGGYWLVGLRNRANLFEGIPWGTGSVLEKTILKAKAAGLRTHLLNALTDIDDLEDLRRILPEWEEKKPYLSVIIPALNEQNHIEKTIRSAADCNAEIIVVDGGSEDFTRARAAMAGARILETHKGRALQQNAGAEKARGDVLLFLHADSRLPESYVDHVFDTLMDPEVIAGAFLFRTDLTTPFMRTIELLANMRSRLFKMPYGDQGLFMKRPVFEAARGFPEVPLGEDFLLVRRLAKRGRIETAPAAILTSARRWRKRGPVRTSMLNQVIVAGLLLGISTRTLARLYRKK